MRRVISLWLPFWPTDRLRRDRYTALPPDVPLVTRGHDGRRMVIAAADGAARQLGLNAGMPLAHAQAMVPGLTVVDATEAEDAAALERLAAWCLRLSPMTSAAPMDAIWIDATGCTHLHDGEQPMLDLLAEHLRQAGLTGKIAIADTPGAAHALAHYSTVPVTIVAPGSQAAALERLPVEALRIDGEVASGLRRLGIEQIGQLVATPRGPLARRFGNRLLIRLDQALGHVHEPIQPVLPPETITVRRTFVEPLSTAEAFVAVILVLVGEACVLLEQRGEGARRLDLVFERIDATCQVVRIGTARPVRDLRHLARLLDERVEEVDPGPGVEAMRLVLPLVEPLSYTQRGGGLAPGETEEADLSELIDRLVNRLGPDKVYRLRSIESEVPERSQQPVSVYTPPPPTAVASRWPRPVRLLERPEPVETLAMMPDHPPKAFTWRRIRHRIVRADGPERITGEWWRRSAELIAVRDYWIVENQEGRRFWLFRQGDGVDSATGELAWFLHGFF
ncbi:DNA polymerase Y family protein [Lichenicola cladoniae]|uniref:DNA polymerase Y family protein n=1 Tax=Lichenicola cladoniae TaxID=1484109 RepID=A0A6M8HUQ2_9PROT|nr:DNA polymerase Y family protein [Lichenicola cladoniae]NPD66650.1 DNA polymerase Y family protein [Acetobacteraceae bacterium]QKE92279.1 DNA polymerase Y family protein [Lichenicola cladoniae]